MMTFSYRNSRNLKALYTLYLFMIVNDINEEDKFNEYLMKWKETEDS